jgi:hypothetical protein
MWNGDRVDYQIIVSGGEGRGPAPRRHPELGVGVEGVVGEHAAVGVEGGGVVPDDAAARLAEGHGSGVDLAALVVAGADVCENNK